MGRFRMMALAFLAIAALSLVGITLLAQCQPVTP